jgi:hypothetical protein
MEQLMRSDKGFHSRGISSSCAWACERLESIIPNALVVTGADDGFHIVMPLLFWPPAVGVGRLGPPNALNVLSDIGGVIIPLMLPVDKDAAGLINDPAIVPDTEGVKELYDMVLGGGAIKAANGSYAASASDAVDGDAPAVNSKNIVI